MNITKTLIFIPQIGLVTGSLLMGLQFLAEALREAMALAGREPSPGAP
jgi:predicted membrane-bound spermidine synthase